MIIQGLQKLTLLDYPGKVACTVFTGGCNFRCPFCHNASLAVSSRSGENENIAQAVFFDFLKKRRGILDGVCITGGEPLLNRDIADFIVEIRALGYSVKLDTNGSFPERLAELLDADLLDYVAMDIKNSREKYPLTVGVPNFDVSAVERSAELLLRGKTPFEFRTTVVATLHEKRDFEKIGEWLSGAQRYYLQNFVDSGDLILPGMSGFDREAMTEFLGIVAKYIPNAELRGV